MRRATRLGLAYGGAMGVLLLVFALYTRPEMLVTLSEQLWACFN